MIKIQLSLRRDETKNHKQKNTITHINEFRVPAQAIGLDPTFVRNCARFGFLEPAVTRPTFQPCKHTDGCFLMLSPYYVQ